MSLVPPPFEHVEGQPFARDAFDLKPIAERLSNVLRAETRPLVMTLSAPWGRGKTTFCTEWRALLHQLQPATRTLWFNAWAEDHAEDPLLSFIGVLEEAVNSEKKPSAARKAGLGGVDRRSTLARKPGRDARPFSLLKDEPHATPSRPH